MQTITATARTRNWTVVFTDIALAGFIYFIVVVLAMHLVRPSFNPGWKTIGDYGVGSLRPWLSSAFYGLSVGSLSLLIALEKSIARAGKSRIGWFIFGIWCKGSLFAAMFNEPVLDSPEENFRLLESAVTFSAFISIVVSSFIILKFRKDPVWKKHVLIARRLAFMLLITFILFAFSVYELKAIAGFAQRIFIAVVLIWFLMLTSWARAAAREKSDK